MDERIRSNKKDLELIMKTPHTRRNLQVINYPNTPFPFGKRSLLIRARREGVENIPLPRAALTGPAAGLRSRNGNRRMPITPSDSSPRGNPRGRPRRLNFEREQEADGNRSHAATSCNPNRATPRPGNAEPANQPRITPRRSPRGHPTPVNQNNTSTQEQAQRRQQMPQSIRRCLVNKMRI